MKGVFKSILSAMLGRQNTLATSSLPVLSTQATEQDLELSSSDRCQRILNYWLDTELFDLPECPLDFKKSIISEPADRFIALWGDAAEEKIITKQLKVTAESRLLIMFQCHIAGYITKADEKHPNYQVPRTYLVAQAMVPKWNAEQKQLTWARSEDSQDLILNLATIRTLYRRCRSSVPTNMSISEWFESRIETIETLLHSALDTEDGTALTSGELQNRIISINRELADEFWPDAQARQYMQQHCQPIESNYASKFDEPHELKNGSVTFRWRFCYYPEESESQQLGPFFVKDLEQAIDDNQKEGTAGLSPPLRAYLLGQAEQIAIGDATNQGEFFVPLTNNVIHGRWPENPQYGLSLLQAVAVNVARKVKQNPIVAVNGPPGTGKTTLLKDIIADQFVARTYLLNQLSEQSDWLDDKDTIAIIMQHSMVVASSNNKAVENISKELPALSQLASEFTDSVTHFREQAPNGDWGLFCAVLGNSANRRKFKASLKKIREHIKSINDIFNLNDFYKSLSRNGQEGAGETFALFIEQWQQQQKLLPLIADIKRCQAYKSHDKFFEPFTDALLKIVQDELSIAQFASSLDCSGIVNLAT